MSLRPQLEAIIYAAETPISLDQIYSLVKDSLLAEAPGNRTGGNQVAHPRHARRTGRGLLRRGHGIEIRQVAGGYRMSTKPEQHDVVRAFAKSLKPPFRLSLPALETLAVVAYKQPVTVPEISEIRGVDSGGVIATLLDRKAHHDGGQKSRDRPSDSLQDQQGISAALRTEGHPRTAQHGRIREAAGGVVPERPASERGHARAEALFIFAANRFFESSGAETESAAESLAESPEFEPRRNRNASRTKPE
jgi:chromosome segregation and condensation protein ScpB